ncbi:MAG: TolC family protein [Thermodesulfovibrionales bacterium]|nr:TolC family protein [Thermodesulfovibrionales bacterium]
MLISVSFLHALTMDEAISLSKESLPSYKASVLSVRSSEALYKATLSPYFPSLDASASYQRLFRNAEEFDSRLYDLTLSYTLFDWGNRSANRTIGKLNLDISNEALRKAFLDLSFQVKVAFYTAMALQESVEQRTIQLRDANTDFDVAEGRYEFGVARLSDVLQVSVRKEQAKFNLIQTEGDFRKALTELNSLIGKPLENTYDLEGSLEIEGDIPDSGALAGLALQKPLVKQAECTVRIAAQNTKISRSSFFPFLSASAGYTKFGGDALTLTSYDEEKTAALTATWNIFELGKFFTYKSSVFEETIAEENFRDIKRQVLLDVQKTYEDLRTDTGKVLVAREQVRQAEQNYSQALGEYKVGKGDITTLVQAESLLADARDQLIRSRLNRILTKALLEQVTGIEKLESFVPAIEKK